MQPKTESWAPRWKLGWILVNKGSWHLNAELAIWISCRFYFSCSCWMRVMVMHARNVLLPALDFISMFRLLAHGIHIIPSRLFSKHWMRWVVTQFSCSFEFLMILSSYFLNLHIRSDWNSKGCPGEVWPNRCWILPFVIVQVISFFHRHSSLFLGKGWKKFWLLYSLLCSEQKEKNVRNWDLVTLHRK